MRRSRFPQRKTALPKNIGLRTRFPIVNLALCNYIPAGPRRSLSGCRPTTDCPCRCVAPLGGETGVVMLLMRNEDGVAGALGATLIQFTPSVSVRSRFGVSGTLPSHVGPASLCPVCDKEPQVQSATAPPAMCSFPIRLLDSMLFPQ
jgi:hypothetical protein